MPVAEAGDLEEELALVELVSRVLDRGVVLAGNVTISVAGIDLVHLFLNLTLTSTETQLERADRAQSSRPEDGG